ncbi:hypothetical protein DAH66_06075 [Sphingomonas koreensis]|uniref:Uncharacterized protein n=1 Tax=Sphingomonas koreensis TaxID=93064 RepID=A0A430G612_9SPHN|nr:hypothetical protein [Sphingomonas koreensis]RSY88026.1 hypothetical protein DAH66_06075 [Sphingomonas koreensis]
MRWKRLGLALAGMLLALGALILVSAAMAQEADRAPETPDLTAPDFTTVTTKAAANRLVRAGRLVKIHYFPTELGGPAKDRYNIGYITPEAAEARELLIGTLEADVEEGTIDQMSIVPDYSGNSIIPTRIRFMAWHSERKGGEFAVVLEVW